LSTIQGAFICKEGGCQFEACLHIQSKFLILWVENFLDQVRTDKRIPDYRQSFRVVRTFEVLLQNFRQHEVRQQVIFPEAGLHELIRICLQLLFVLLAQIPGTCDPLAHLGVLVFSGKGHQLRWDTDLPIEPPQQPNAAPPVCTFVLPAKFL